MFFTYPVLWPNQTNIKKGKVWACPRFGWKHKHIFRVSVCLLSYSAVEVLQKRGTEKGWFCTRFQNRKHIKPNLFKPRKPCISRNEYSFPSNDPERAEWFKKKGITRRLYSSPYWYISMIDPQYLRFSIIDSCQSRRQIFPDRSKDKSSQSRQRNAVVWMRRPLRFLPRQNSSAQHFLFN